MEVVDPRRRLCQVSLHRHPGETAPGCIVLHCARMPVVSRRAEKQLGQLRGRVSASTLDPTDRRMQMRLQRHTIPPNPALLWRHLFPPIGAAPLLNGRASSALVHRLSGRFSHRSAGRDLDPQQSAAVGGYLPPAVVLRSIPMARRQTTAHRPSRSARRAQRDPIVARTPCSSAPGSVPAIASAPVRAHGLRSAARTGASRRIRLRGARAVRARSRR